VLIDLIKLKKPFFTVFILAALVFLAYAAVSRLYPLKHIELIREYSDKYDLRPELVCAVIHTESRFRDEAVSRKGASGLMQALETTANWAADEIGIENYNYARIFEPGINIEIGCWYLNRLINQYKNIDTALAAYNSGSGNVSGWLKNPQYSSDGVTLDMIPFAETRNYVVKVNESIKVYELILRFK